MNRKQLESRAYVKPFVSACGMQTESLLQTFSSHHNPGHHGTGPSSAKQGWFDEEEVESLIPSSSSEGGNSLWNE